MTRTWREHAPKVALIVSLVFIAAGLLARAWYPVFMGGGLFVLWFLDAKRKKADEQQDASPRP